MNQQQIKKTLQNIELNFDEDTISSVARFLIEEIGFHQDYDFLYEICAGAAIVSEYRKIPSVDNKEVTNGIHIENIMRHLPGLSKEKFLQTLTNQVKKWNKAPSFLLVRIDAVSISYRLFKKYKEVFLILCNEVVLDNEITSQLLAFFWILYLLVKLKNHDPSNILENTKILYSLLSYLASNTNITPSTLRSVLNKHFRQVGEIGENVQANYLSQIRFQIQEAFKSRYWNKEPNLRNLIENPIMLRRLVDDIGNKYNKIIAQLPKCIIDEITYLQLKKTLTPHQVTNHVDDGIQPITRTIDFSNDDDEKPLFNFNTHHQTNTSSDFIHNQHENHLHNQHQHKKLSTFLGENSSRVNFNMMSPLPQRNLLLTETPVSFKLQNMNWVRQCLDSVNEVQVNKLKQVIKMYSGRQWKQFEKSAFEKINRVVMELTPNCMHLTKRENQIYAFYQFILIKISNSHSENDKEDIFSRGQNLNSLLCIATELFNFSYQSLTGQFKKYCQIFQVNIVNAFKPINWMGKRLQLPQGLHHHLYHLEKQILIQQIWEDNTGYQLITNKDNMRFTDCALISRLQRHIKERITQLSKIIGIDPKQVFKIEKLVLYLLENKPNLLKNNKIDQIIICSITFYLKQQNPEGKGLADIFELYNQASLSFYSLRDNLRDINGKQLNLLDFYNDVFLQEVQSSINSDNNLLATPIRNQLLSKAKNALNSTPIAVKYREDVLANEHLFGTKKLKKDGYQIGLFKNFKKMSQENEDNNDSPRFGLKKSMSFGRPS